MFRHTTGLSRPKQASKARGTSARAESAGFLQGDGDSLTFTVPRASSSSACSGHLWNHLVLVSPIRWIECPPCHQQHYHWVLSLPSLLPKKAITGLLREAGETCGPLAGVCQGAGCSRQEVSHQQQPQLWEFYAGMEGAGAWGRDGDIALV